MTQTLDPTLIECVNTNMRMFTRVLTQFYDRILEPGGLLITQYTLLAAIHKTEPITLQPLADFLLMDRTTLTRNLKGLERDGLVQTTVGETDKRTRVVSLTDEGHAVYERATPLWQPHWDSRPVVEKYHLPEQQSVSDYIREHLQHEG